MGDFNYPHICWEANSGKYGPFKKFPASVVDCFLLEKVEEEITGVATLDLILTNIDDLTKEMVVKGTLGESGHVLLGF